MKTILKEMYDYHYGRRVKQLEKTARTVLENGCPLTVAELALILINADNYKICPFSCGKDKWGTWKDGEGFHGHRDGCPFAIAYQVLTPEAVEEIPEPDNGMDAKASAVGMAQSLDLDAAVRTVAKSGKTHGGGHNWHAEWGNFEISATFGAGTNSASIQLSAGYLGNEPTEVYIASDYGRYIEIFRYGPWVHRLLQHAGELRRAKEAQTKTNEANKAQQEAAKFQEVDF